MGVENWRNWLLRVLVGRNWLLRVDDGQGREELVIAPFAFQQVASISLRLEELKSLVDLKKNSASQGFDIELTLEAPKP